MFIGEPGHRIRAQIVLAAAKPVLNAFGGAVGRLNLGPEA